MKAKKNLIIGCQISGVFDVNRSEIISNDDFSVVLNWYNSLQKYNLNGIIFHNSFSDATCLKYQTENIRFIKIEYNFLFNPNVYRYCIYNEFLKLNHQFIDSVFFTDISDVEILKNPFGEKLFLENKNAIFCGDEPKKLENDWMKNHSEHLRLNIKDYSHFEEKFKHETLLNCGIFGGNISVIRLFIRQLWLIHKKHNSDNKTLFTGDMGAFNYLIRTKYSHNHFHGKPINTEFKVFDTKNTACWFAHK